ncbi:MAG: hypothetical protein Q9227_009379 [Pyrenula ochraceoflavens]
MPNSNEIADSDAESEGDDSVTGYAIEHLEKRNSPDQPLQTPIPEHDLNVNFEDFLSQPQNYDTRYPERSPNKSVNSEVCAPKQYVDSGDAWSAATLRGQLQTAQSYLLDGSSTEIPTNLPSLDYSSMDRLKRRLTDVSPLDTIDSPRQWQDKSKRERARSEAVEKSYDRTLVQESGYATTSQSTMGGYQTYNIDLRGRSGGLVTSANPFAGESSQTGQGDIDADGVAQLGAPYEAGKSASPARSPTSTSDRHLSKIASRQDLSGDISAHAELESHTRTRKVSHCAQNSASETEQHSQRQSGRTYSKKNKRVLYSDDDDDDTNHNRVPQDENVSTDNAIKYDDKPLEAPRKKRGRPPKKRSDDSKDQQDDSREQGSAEDGDEPSAKRRKFIQNQTVPEQDGQERHTTTNITLSSSQKNPSSELNLSDEITIGLPKEQYKPRPSRSRSKRTDGDMDSTERISRPYTKEHITEQGEVDASDLMPPPPSLGRKQAKKKVKRAKTSAVLAKSPDMVDEDDRDVIWFDEKPAAVKLDIPAGDLSPIKKEKMDRNRSESLDEDSVSRTKGEHDVKKLPEHSESEARSLIRVEIPATTSSKQDKDSSSKPRGRKKKAANTTTGNTEHTNDHRDQQELPTARHAVAANSWDDAHSTADTVIDMSSKRRQPLTDQSGNQPKQPSSISDQHVNREKENQDYEMPAASAHPPSAITDEDNTRDPPETPAKAPQTKPDSAEKGPTKHSPIKTSESAVKFRVGLSKRQRIPPLLRMVRK